MCMYNVLGNRAMEGKCKIKDRIKNHFRWYFIVLANGLLISVEQNQSWQTQESIIQFIGAGSEYIQADENQILPRIFSLIPKLNFCNNSIINTTLTVLGKDLLLQKKNLFHFHQGQYSNWLSNHQDILQNCVHLCVNALSNPELIEAASIALKELIKENRMYMSRYLNDIFPIMKVIKIKKILINLIFFYRMFLRIFISNQMIVFVVYQLLVISSQPIHQKLLLII